MKVIFKRHVNPKGEVAWSCKVDGYYITGNQGSMSHSHISRSGRNKALCDLSDFTDFINYISDTDLRREWREQ